MKNNLDQTPLAQALVSSYLGDYAMERTLSKALKKLHRNDEAKDLVARAKAIVESGNNPFEDQTVDVVALRHQ